MLSLDPSHRGDVADDHRECITENAARTVKRLKEILHKRDCRIAPVAYLFEKKGVIVVSAAAGRGFDELFEVAVEAGAEDVREVEDEDGMLYEVRPMPLARVP